MTRTLEEGLRLWQKYCDSKSQSEKDAILKQICPGITPEGLEIMRREYTEEELAGLNKPDSQMRDEMEEKMLTFIISGDWKELPPKNGENK